MAFASDLMGIPVIGDTRDIRASAGMAGYDRRDRTVDPEGGFAKPMTIPVFDRQKIKELAKEREQSGKRIFDVMQQAGIKPLNQGSTNFCWANAPCDAVQVIRVLRGMPHVPLSPASVGSLVTNGSNVGGWPLKWIKRAVTDGIATQATWSPNAIGKKYDTPESRASREPFKIDADGWVDLPQGDWDAVFTYLVLGFPVTLCHMEWSHAVLAIDVGIMSNGELAALCRNSGYGRDSTGHSWVRESFGKPDDALAVQGITGG